MNPEKWKNIQQNLIKTNFVISYNGIPTQKHTLAHAIDHMLNWQVFIESQFTDCVTPTLQY